MTSFLGIWDTEYYFGRTDQTFDLSQMWPQQVAIVSVLSVGRWQSVTAMAKKAKKVPFDPKVFLATVNGGRSISNISREPKGLLAG